MADTTEQQRLLRLEKINDQLQKEKKHLKDIKDGTTDVANKDKEISKSIKKQNDLLKEQKGLKKAIASESEKEVKLQDILESYEKRINLLVKTSTKDEKEQLRAKDGIVDRSKIILEVAETAKKTEGEKGDILAEIAVLMHDIDDTSIQNLQSERDIGKEGFKQLSLKDKEKRFAEIKRRIGEEGLRNFEEELHYLETSIDQEKAKMGLRESQNSLVEQGNSLFGDMIKKGTEWINKFKINPLDAVITGMVIGMKLLQEQFDNIGKRFGAIGLQNERFSKDLLIARSDAIRLGKSMEDVTAVVGELTNEFGMSNERALAMASGIIDTSVALGLSVTEGAKLVGILRSTTSLSEEQAQSFLKQVTLLSQGAGVAPVDILKDMSNSFATIAKFSDESGENIAKASIMALKLGTNLDTVAGIAEGLLDFESSINKEVETSVLLGRQLNFQRARELALANDIEGAMANVVSQLGTEEEFNRLNVIQRKALSDTIGVSVSQLSEFVQNQDRAVTLGQKLADQKGFEELVGPEAISSLSNMMNSLKSLGAILLETVVPPLEMMAMFLDATVGNILRFAKTIRVILLPALTAWATRAALASFAQVGLVSASTLGIGVAAIVAGMASFQAFSDSFRPKRFANLPAGEMATIQSGIGIADAGESIVHTTDIAGAGMNKQDIDSLKREMIGVKDAITSLRLETKITNKDLNLILTPSNG